MLKTLINEILAMIAGVISFFLLSNVTLMILLQVTGQQTNIILTMINILLIGPGSMYLGGLVSKRMCGDAYWYYALVFLVNASTIIFAFKQSLGLGTIPAPLILCVLCAYLYVDEYKKEKAQKAEERAERERRIAAGLPETVEEEEELRREEEQARKDAEDAARYKEILYNEDEPDMWDEPVEDEDELLHEEYHGAYESYEKGEATEDELEKLEELEAVPESVIKEEIEEDQKQKAANRRSRRTSRQ